MPCIFGSKKPHASPVDAGYIRYIPITVYLCTLTPYIDMQYRENAPTVCNNRYVKTSGLKRRILQDVVPDITRAHFRIYIYNLFDVINSNRLRECLCIIQICMDLYTYSKEVTFSPIYSVDKLFRTCSRVTESSVRQHSYYRENPCHAKIYCLYF